MHTVLRRKMRNGSRVCDLHCAMHYITCACMHDYSRSMSTHMYVVHVVLYILHDVCFSQLMSCHVIMSCDTLTQEKKLAYFHDLPQTVTFCFGFCTRTWRLSLSHFWNEPSTSKKSEKMFSCCPDCITKHKMWFTIFLLNQYLIFFIYFFFFCCKKVKCFFFLALHCWPDYMYACPPGL